MAKPKANAMKRCGRASHAEAEGETEGRRAGGAQGSANWTVCTSEEMVLCNASEVRTAMAAAERAMRPRRASERKTRRPNQLNRETMRINSLAESLPKVSSTQIAPCIERRIRREERVQRKAIVRNLKLQQTTRKT